MIDFVAAIDSVQKSLKSELSSRFFSCLKFFGRTGGRGGGDEKRFAEETGWWPPGQAGGGHPDRQEGATRTGGEGAGGRKGAGKRHLKFSAAAG